MRRHCANNYRGSSTDSGTSFLRSEWNGISRGCSSEVTLALFALAAGMCPQRDSQYGFTERGSGKGVTRPPTQAYPPWRRKRLLRRGPGRPVRKPCSIMSDFSENYGSNRSEGIDPRKPYVMCSLVACALQGADRLGSELPSGWPLG